MAYKEAILSEGAQKPATMEIIMFKQTFAALAMAGIVSTGAGVVGGPAFAQEQAVKAPQGTDLRPFDQHNYRARHHSKRAAHHHRQARHHHRKAVEHLKHAEHQRHLKHPKRAAYHRKEAQYHLSRARHHQVQAKQRLDQAAKRHGQLVKAATQKQ